VLGARTFNKGLSELSQGLKSGDPKVERDPRGRGSMGKLVSKGGGMQLRSVTSLEERINAIRNRIQIGKTDPRVIKWARAQVTRKCGADWCVPEKNTPKEIAAIFKGIRLRRLRIARCGLARRDRNPQQARRGSHPRFANLEPHLGRGERNEERQGAVDRTRRLSARARRMARAEESSG
jgi:hypothetical protein